MFRLLLIDLFVTRPLGCALATRYLQAGGNLDSTPGDGTRGTRLCDAAAAGDVRTLALLKEAAVFLDRGDYDDRYALHLAAANGRLLAVSYLLSTGANPNVQDRWGSTPIEDALRNGHTHCAVLLRANGGELGPSPSAEVVAAADALDPKGINETRLAVKKLLAKVRAFLGACQRFRPYLSIAHRQ